MKKLLFLLIISALASACGNKAKLEQAEAMRIKQITIDSLNTVVAKQKIIDSMNTVKANAHVIHNANATGYDAAASETSSAKSAPAKKRGWTGAEKGAVIGAGTGAIAGALINERTCSGTKTCSQ